MNLLFALYASTIGGSIVLAGGLALLGCQLAARDRAMQTLCMGQGAMLGVLLGLGIVQVLIHEVPTNSLVPLGFGCISAAFTFLVSELLVARKTVSTNTDFVSLFSILLAGGYLISALFPTLENHMAQKYFGDLATLSTQESYWCLAVGCSLVVIMIIYNRNFTRDSFEKTITGRALFTKSLSGFSKFDVLNLFILCFCIQTVGYLFTMACLFIPTTIASRALPAGLRNHLSFCAFVSSGGAGIGFIMSLTYKKLPTVPTIIACILISSVLVLVSSYVICKFFSRSRDCIAS